MYILNLTDNEKSDIKFQISKFPDGQQSVTITNCRQVLDITQIAGHPVTIKSRLNSFKDLELIICTTQALRDLRIKEIHLYVPYFIGARSDRKFVQGSTNYLKNVICPIINSQNFETVKVIDPHSDVLEACLNNYIKEDNHRLVKFALPLIDNKDGAQKRVVLVSPDAGAYKKIFDVAQRFGIENVVTASKHRDIQTGKITHTEIPNIEQYGEDHKFVIVDDICDGGRTFTELAKEIRKHNILSEIHLIVTHGIFSAGLKPLNEVFTKIFCTDSYSDINEPHLSPRKPGELDQIKQLNVF
jgi:ribose-phosphate pyrophosphokinase